MAEQNWTTNQNLADLVDELDILISRFAAIGEEDMAITLQAVSVARIVDGDLHKTALGKFQKPASDILRAAIS